MVKNLNNRHLNQAVADPDTRLLVVENLEDELRGRGIQLLDENNTTLSLSSAIDLISILSASEFERSHQEIANVYGLIMKSMRDKDIPPYVIDHLPKERQYGTKNALEGLKQKMDLGRRCFIAYGLFRKALEYRSKRNNAPNATFYRDVGAQCLHHSNMEDVSKNFDNWTNFLHVNVRKN